MVIMSSFKFREVTKSMIGTKVLSWPAHKIYRKVELGIDEFRRDRLVRAHVETAVLAGDLIREEI